MPLVFYNGGSGKHRLPRTGHQWEGDGELMGEHLVDRLVQVPDRQPEQVRGDGHDCVTSAESLFGRQPAAGAKQLWRDLVHDSGAWPFVDACGSLHRLGQLPRWVAGPGQLVPPAGQEVLDAFMHLVFPGGPGGDGTDLGRGVGADGGVDLGRAGGVHLPRFSRDAGNDPAA
jgi:hypothetical protein